MTGRRRGPRWRDELEAELAAIDPSKRGVVKAFADKHKLPITAVRSKVAALRIKGTIPDVRPAHRSSPLPSPRHRWLSARH